MPRDKHIRLLRGLSPINPTHWCRLWGWLERVYDPQNGSGLGFDGSLLLAIDIWLLGAYVSTNLQWELYRFSYEMHFYWFLNYSLV
jgi:hypothetical protein